MFSNYTTGFYTNGFYTTNFYTINNIFLLGIITTYISTILNYFNINNELDNELDNELGNELDNDIDLYLDDTRVDDIIKKSPIIFSEKYIDKFNNLKEFDIEKEILDNLKNTITMENTPNGNVIMFWDNNRETFTYYSDGTIPYQFLEVVSRKYVIENNCKKIYIVMKDEINIAEQKIEREKEKEKEKEKELKEIELKKEIENEIEIEKSHKKDIFVKFKNYNKDNKYSTISIDNKNLNKSIPKNSNTIVSSNKYYILKENANRYSYEGKLINFSFLKKVDRKKIDKKYSMNFSDYKKIKN